MSLIGTLEQINLTSLLQRLESYAKTGLLVVQQGKQWVELYFRDGRLICIGPVRTQANLGSRLLQEGYISVSALQETLYTLGGAEASETRIALTLMDLGHITHEQLRSWATKKTYEVLHVLLSWTSGDVHFEENFAPPGDRLLVAIVLSSLLPAQSSPAPTASARPGDETQSARTEQLSNREPLKPRFTKASEISNVPTLLEPDQFGLETGSSSPNKYMYAENARPDFSPFFSPVPTSNAIFSQPEPATPESGAKSGNDAGYTSVFEGSSGGNVSGDAFLSDGNRASDDQAFVSFLDDDSGSDTFGSSSGRRQPEFVTTPFTPRRIDVAFMQPEMILLPVNFSSALAQNPSVQITPEQWMVFAQVDGQTSLQRVCMNLGTHPSQVCQVVGELLAEGLIQICMPDALPMKDFSPLSRDGLTSSMNNGYITPGYASMPVPPWSAGVPTQDAASRPAGNSFESQSQWGNGANGASFNSGQGWIASPQPLRPLSSGGLPGPYPHNMHVPVGGNY